MKFWIEYNLNRNSKTETLPWKARMKFQSVTCFMECFQNSECL